MTNLNHVEKVLNDYFKDASFRSNLVSNKIAHQIGVSLGETINDCLQELYEKAEEPIDIEKIFEGIIIGMGY